MPEDRLGDLGRRGDGRPEEADDRDPILGDDPRPASERLAELDERRSEDALADAGADRPQPRGRRDRRYLGLVAVLFAALILYAVFDTASNLAGESDQSLLRGPPVGSRVPDFAAPLATGSLEGDANVRPANGGGDAAGPRPACEVRSPDVFNICTLRARPLVLTFIVTRGTRCAPALADVERMRRQFPGVMFAAVVSGSDRGDVEKLVREGRVTMPVAVDRDGAVVNLYRVGVCPTTVFSAAGGQVRAARLGELDRAELAAGVRTVAPTRGGR